MEVVVVVVEVVEGGCGVMRLDSEVTRKLHYGEAGQVRQVLEAGQVTVPTIITTTTVFSSYLLN